MYTYKVLFDGYSRMNEDTEILANCSCTLVQGPKNVIVDTMTSWDSQKILDALQECGVTVDEISYVVSTHGHSDHIGNNNLFLKATHIVGFSVSFRDTYFLHPFDKGAEYVIDDCLRVIPTPGHTLTDVTLLLRTENGQVVAVAGDLFECYEDIHDPNRWIEAGSEAPDLQRQNRSKVADLATLIIPGHGPAFLVTPEIRKTLSEQRHLK